MVENFEAKLNEYAHLLVEVGMNVQPGQTPYIRGPVDCAPLIRKCVAASYDAGARDVIVEWNDDFLAREKYLKADEAVFSEFPEYVKKRYDYMVETKCPLLSVIGSDPEMLKGVDPDRIRTWQITSGENIRHFRDAMTAGMFQWSIGAHPTKAWAEKVFPELKGEEAMDALWDAIFSTCRVTGDGKAVERWQAHVSATAERCRILNEMDLVSLHYTNDKGTDLTIQLPENHIWAGGSEDTRFGITSVPNIPTEEIFTAPHCEGVNGRVYSALPLALDGNLIKDFYMDFENGKIVNVHAEEGEEFLRSAITLDEGASYLGEVALVQYDSPIRETGILFYNTLFDENASCHLAFGAAYSNCVKGGELLPAEEQRKLGLNQSITHVDFMIGTRDLSIVGTTRDGKEVPVFVDGNFAF